MKSIELGQVGSEEAWVECEESGDAFDASAYLFIRSAATGCSML